LDAVNVVDAASPAAETGARRSEALETASVAEKPQLQPPDVTAEQPGSPWNTAAASGAAFGRKYKDAGVATAGAFKRFARRVAGSF